MKKGADSTGKVMHI